MEAESNPASGKRRSDLRLCFRLFLRPPCFHQVRQLLPGSGTHWRTALGLLGSRLSLPLAQRCFIAAETRLRAAGLIVRRLWPSVGAACNFGGRPRRGADGPASPSSAEIAWLMRTRSDLSSANTFSRFTRILSGGVVVEQCSSRVRGGTAQPGPVETFRFAKVLCGVLS
jgi:hypothetical protein